MDENGDRGLISGTIGNTNGNNGRQSRQRSRRNGTSHRGLGGGVVREGGDNARGSTSSNSSGPGFTVFVEVPTMFYLLLFVFLNFITSLLGLFLCWKKSLETNSQ